MPNYTTSGLVANIKRRVTVPTSQNLFQPEDIVAFANDELQSFIVPLIMSVREEHFVAVYEVSVEANQQYYEIPGDAIGMKLRAVDVINDQSNNTIWSSLARLEPEDVSGNYWDYGQPTGFYLQGNSVVLYPIPQSGGTLRLTYFKRCSELVYVNKAGLVSNVDTNTNEVTLSTVPAGWVVGTLVDVVNPNPPFNTPKTQLEITAVNGFTVTLSDVTGIVNGYWVCLTGETVVAYIPVECQNVLAQAAACKLLEALGDSEGLKRSQAKLEEIIKQMMTILNPRVDGSPKKITSHGNGLAEWNRINVRRPW